MSSDTTNKAGAADNGAHLICYRSLQYYLESLANGGEQ